MILRKKFRIRPGRKFTHYIEKSGLRGSSIKAEILDETGTKIHNFSELTFSLPRDILANKPMEFGYSFPNHYLSVSGLEKFPVEEVIFDYFVEFRPVRAKDRLEGIAEVLSIYVFG